MNSIQRELKVVEKTTGNAKLDTMRRLFDRVSLMHCINLPNKYRGTGVTFACVTINNMNYFGVAFCGKKDQFSRKMGREIALGRAVKAYMNKEGYAVDDALVTVSDLRIPTQLYITKR